MHGPEIPQRDLTPDLLLQAYRAGIFPMAESRDTPELFWLDPRRRGVLPLERFHISRSLARRIRGGGFRVSTDEAFHAVMTGCAAREETWINDRIVTLFCDLHARGHAHSLEIWEGETLAGGVYGLAINAVFFGESMFSARRDGSKLALAYLVHRLRAGGFTLFDTQFLTPHLASLGAVEISRALYHDLLRKALQRDADFDRFRGMPTVQSILQPSTQTS